MRVSKHAVDMFIERIMSMDYNRAGEAARDVAYSHILKAYYEPEHVLKKSDKDCPIHVRGSVAIPIAENGNVPTTYHSNTFEERISNGAR